MEVLKFAVGFLVAVATFLVIYWDIIWYNPDPFVFYPFRVWMPEWLDSWAARALFGVHGAACLLSVDGIVGYLRETGKFSKVFIP